MISNVSDKSEMIFKTYFFVKIGCMIVVFISEY